MNWCKDSIHRILYEPQSIAHRQECVCSIGFIAKLSAVAIFELLIKVVKFHQLLSSLFIKQTSDAYSPPARTVLWTTSFCRS